MESLKLVLVLLLSFQVSSLRAVSIRHFLIKEHAIHNKETDYKQLFSHEKIVDGAGYSMHNTAFSLDLAMQARAPVESEVLGSVILGPYQNGRDQKWGTSFYGTNQVALSNGLVGKNIVSVYYPEGSSRDRARLYAFQALSTLNEYRVLNLENHLCLVANQRNSEEPITVDFGSCEEGNSTWLLRRTG